MTIDPTKPQYDVFISYARKDGLEFAERLEKELNVRGIRTWRDKRNLDVYEDFTAEIEIGIHQSKFICICVTPSIEQNPESFVRREINYARQKNKPLIPLRLPEADMPVDIINLTWIGFFDPANMRELAYEPGLTQLLDRLKSNNEPNTYVVTGDPFQKYLETLYDRIVDYLNLTVIKEIELKAFEAPDKVSGGPTQTRNLLGGFFVRAGKQGSSSTNIQVATLKEGFEKFEGRVLLLGEPGAGKTTALMAFARNAIYERLDHPENPLPILARCPSWDSQKQIPLAEWLAEESGLEQARIEALLRDGKALLLLDALDELGSEREEEITNAEGEMEKHRYDPRKRFLSILPPNNQIVITSRITDYDDIGEKLPFPGAVTLSKLTNEQIEDYLTNVSGLWEAMKDDEALLDIARTPLLLSLMAYAFRDAADDVQQLGDLSEGDLRDAIFERFVKERYEHEKRSGGEMRFSLDEIREYLGSLAMENADGWRNTLGLLTVDDITDVPDSANFITLILHLNLLLPDERGYRFIHLRLRDHFAYPVALQSLNDPNEGVRGSAADVLGKIGDARAVEPLIAALDDPYENVRISAADALGKLGDPRGIDTLITMMSDNSFGMDDHIQVIDTLVNIGALSVEPLIVALYNANEFVRSNAADALGQIGDARAIGSLIAVLNDLDEQVRVNAVAALGQIGDASAIESLIAVLDDLDEDVRVNAVVALGQIGDASAIESLIAVLDDLDEDVRRSAAEVLGQIGDARVVEPLITILSDPEWIVRSSVANALGHIRDARAIEPLIAALREPDADVRHRTAVALGKIGNARAVEPLIAALHDPDVSVSSSAAYALGKISDARAVEPLIGLLSNALQVNLFERVYDIASEALENIGTPEALEAVRLWREKERRG